MKDPALDLKAKVKFSSLEELVNYHLKNNITLTYIELDYIYHHMLYRKSTDKYFNPKYKKCYEAVKYLMENLHDEQFYALVNLLNRDFDFQIEYCINSDVLDKNFLGDEVAGYSYSCKNPETAEYLIELASKMQTKQKTMNFTLNLLILKTN